MYHSELRFGVVAVWAARATVNLSTALQILSLSYSQMVPVPYLQPLSAPLMMQVSVQSFQKCWAEMRLYALPVCPWTTSWLMMVSVLRQVVVKRPRLQMWKSLATPPTLPWQWYLGFSSSFTLSAERMVRPALVLPPLASAMAQLERWEAEALSPPCGPQMTPLVPIWQPVRLRWLICPLGQQSQAGSHLPLLPLQSTPRLLGFLMVAALKVATSGSPSLRQVRMLSRWYSSKRFWVMISTMVPARPKLRLTQWKQVPGLWVGEQRQSLQNLPPLRRISLMLGTSVPVLALQVASRKLEQQGSHSRREDWWLRIISTVMSTPGKKGFSILKPKMLERDWLSATFFCSTSCRMATEEKLFETEAMRKSVELSIGWLASFFSPRFRLNTTCCPCVTCTCIPFSCRSVFSAWISPARSSPGVAQQTASKSNTSKALQFMVDYIVSVQQYLMGIPAIMNLCNNNQQGFKRGRGRCRARPGGFQGRA